MTDKILPVSIVLVDFKFSQLEIEKLKIIVKEDITINTISKLESIIGNYLGSTIIFHQGANPKSVKITLEKTKKHLEKGLRLFKSFIGISGVDALIFDGMNGIPPQGCSVLTM